jgi:hypothetical protein
VTASDDGIADVLVNLAWGFILALGIIAALNQLHIANNVLNAVLSAALAGIAIVAVGGGGIKTMSQRREVPQPDSTRECCASPPPGTPSLTDQASQATPADTGRSSHGAAGTPPHPAEPHSQPDDRGDDPTGTGS